MPKAGQTWKGLPHPKAEVQTSWEKVSFSPLYCRTVLWLAQARVSLRSPALQEATFWNAGGEWAISKSWCVWAGEVGVQGTGRLLGELVSM